MSEEQNKGVGDESEIDLGPLLDFLKSVDWRAWLILAFLILGLFLRVQHLNAPSIGYHNMKENEQIDETVRFLEDGGWLHRKTFIFNGLSDGPGYFEEYVQAPLIAYMTAPFWAVFGKQLWIPRLFMVLFMLGSILMTYFLVKELSGNEYLSLLSSFLITVMPLGIFFGRNIQPESPGLFFLLLSSYFYVKWVKTKLNRPLLGLYAFLSLAVMASFKVTFLIILLPWLAIFPYRRFFSSLKSELSGFLEFFSSSFWKSTLGRNIFFPLLGFSPFVAVYAVFRSIIVHPSRLNQPFAFHNLLTADFFNSKWSIFKSFLKDNFTIWLLILALLGLIFILIKYRTLFSKFLLAWFLSFFVYASILADKMAGHSYYQMPFLPLICILLAYFLFSLGSLLKQVSGKQLMLFIPLILLVVGVPSLNGGNYLVYKSWDSANDRVFGTVFYGQDYIGKEIKKRTSEGERFFLLSDSAQHNAVCTYAERRCGAFRNLSHLKEKEEELGIRVMSFGPRSFMELQKERKKEWRYIKNNYHLELLGLLRRNDRLVPNQFVLEKGGSFNLSEFSNKKPRKVKSYDSVRGQVPYFVIRRRD